MNHGQTIFQQLISFLPDREFRRCVARYQGNTSSRSLSCGDQYLAMAFAQLTYRESLRDIKAFFGTSENAVKTQIWIAVSVYVLVAIACHAKNTFPGEPAMGQRCSYNLRKGFEPGAA